MQNIYAVYLPLEGNNEYVKRVYYYNAKENKWYSDAFPAKSWPTLPDALADVGIIVPMGMEMEVVVGMAEQTAKPKKRKYTRRSFKNSGSQSSIEQHLEPSLAE